ncbi:MAG: hypothetical protein ACFFG0_40855 [Candidatus Thorarchaeota archaeon]
MALSFILPRVILNISEDSKEFTGFYEISGDTDPISEIEINNKIHIGNIEFKQPVEDCFKWKEIVIGILKFTISGEKAIPKSDHMVTTIEFYNWGIYFLTQ